MAVATSSSAWAEDAVDTRLIAQAISTTALSLRAAILIGLGIA
jgi:hypothetical protein